RTRPRIVRRAGEGVGTGAVREVVQAAAADVGDVDTKAQLVLAIGIRGKIRPVEVVLGTTGVGLRPARSEQAGDCDLSIGIDAVDRIVEVTHQQTQLIQPVRRELMQMADVDLVFEKMSIRGRGRKSGTPDILILRRAMLVGVPDPELVAVGQVMKHASRTEEVMRGIRNALRNRSK